MEQKAGRKDGCDGRRDGWMDGWMDGWKEWMTWLDGCSGRMEGGTGWVDRIDNMNDWRDGKNWVEWMTGWVDRWMNGTDAME